MRPSCKTLSQFVLLLALLGSGCVEKDQEFSEVHGRVFFRDRPLSKGMIVFTPDAERGCQGDLASAEIGPDGAYVAKSKKHPGLVPGWYRISVIAFDMTGAPTGFAEPRSLLPEKYRDPDLSGLSVEILPDQVNVRDFHLE